MVMNTATGVPLLPPHIPRDHPVVTRDYSLFTAAIQDMADSIGGWLDDQVDGATIFGPSRFGKSSAVDHWLQRLLSERHGGYVPMVIWSHTDSGSAQAVGRAVLAFAVLLWTYDVEPNVQQHRWPDRPPPAGSAGGLSKRTMAAASVQPPALGTVDIAGQQWLAYHAAGTAMQVAWRDAEAMAALATRIGIVGDVRGAQSPPQAGHWWAAARPHGTLCFVARDHAGTMWQVAPRQDKRARCMALAASRAARHRQVLAACEGPCLTYSMLTGWEAKHGVPPVDAAMRRLRLLGLDGKRPHFWLYRAADGRFVARLCQSRLQALGAAPTTAIAALREAALGYMRRYGSLP